MYGKHFNNTHWEKWTDANDTENGTCEFCGLTMRPAKGIPKQKRLQFHILRRLTQKRPPLEKASLELASLELASLELASLELASHHLLFGKGLPSLRTLYLIFAGTVPANSFLFAGTVPANSFLFAGSVPANNLFLKYFLWGLPYLNQ